jgi:DNA polymerase I-like protein with 3'-5' exonuclease and polymerase domains
MIAQIPLAQAKLAQERYFTEFDGIPAWQSRIKKQVENMEPISNPLGRTITLFGRPWDKHTWRQGLSFPPQSGLADIMDVALYRIWNELEAERVWLMAQVHDAALGQFPRGEMELVRRALQLMYIPVPVTDINGITRVMTIGVEAAVGRNWGHRTEDNPYGIDEAPVAAYLREHPL